MNQNNQQIKPEAKKPAAQEPELTNAELEQVSGGLVNCRKAGGIRPE